MIFAPISGGCSGVDRIVRRGRHGDTRRLGALERRADHRRADGHQGDAGGLLRDRRLHTGVVVARVALAVDLQDAHAHRLEGGLHVIAELLEEGHGEVAVQADDELPLQLRDVLDRLGRALPLGHGRELADHLLGLGDAGASSRRRSACSCSTTCCSNRCCCRTPRPARPRPRSGQRRARALPRVGPATRSSSIPSLGLPFLPPARRARSLGHANRGSRQTTVSSYSCAPMRSLPSSVT